MKLITYSRNSIVSCGILRDGFVIDIPSIWTGPGAPRAVLDILWGGPECLEKIAALAEKTDVRTPVEAVKILAPIPRPGKVIGLSGNYAKHIEEVGKALGLSESPRNITTPRPFLMPSTCVIGPGDEIPWPLYSEEIDYELELGIVVGRTAKYISAKDAPAHIAGYTIANDISARTVTYKQGRAVRPWDEFYDWLNGKWADGFCPLGPYLVTADEIADVQNLDMELKVNGQIRQQANTSQMIYCAADIVTFLSHIMTLEPGDVIATGTPAGVGMATKTFLQPGDVIECRIDGLGTLENKLGSMPKRFYKPLL
jgi:2-keto-4-pentenoate hydratase/2-oxohepta-3-ene-1,7-dioic acid hydratase in catechol pathway